MVERIAQRSSLLSPMWKVAGDTHVGTTSDALRKAAPTAAVDVLDTTPRKLDIKSDAPPPMPTVPAAEWLQDIVATTTSRQPLSAFELTREHVKAVLDKLGARVSDAELDRISRAFAHVDFNAEAPGTQKPNDIAKKTPDGYRYSSTLRPAFQRAVAASAGIELRSPAEANLYDFLTAPATPAADLAGADFKSMLALLKYMAPEHAGARETLGVVDNLVKAGDTKGAERALNAWLASTGGLVAVAQVASSLKDLGPLKSAMGALKLPATLTNILANGNKLATLPVGSKEWLGALLEVADDTGSAATTVGEILAQVAPEGSALGTRAAAVSGLGAVLNVPLASAAMFNEALKLAMQAREKGYYRAIKDKFGRTEPKEFIEGLARLGRDGMAGGDTPEARTSMQRGARTILRNAFTDKPTLRGAYLDSLRRELAKEGYDPAIIDKLNANRELDPRQTERPADIIRRGSIAFMRDQLLALQQSLKIGRTE